MFIHTLSWDPAVSPRFGLEIWLFSVCVFACTVWFLILNPLIWVHWVHPSFWRVCDFSQRQPPLGVLLSSKALDRCAHTFKLFDGTLRKQTAFKVVLEIASLFFHLQYMKVRELCFCLAATHSVPGLSACFNKECFTNLCLYLGSFKQHSGWFPELRACFSVPVLWFGRIWDL